MIAPLLLAATLAMAPPPTEARTFGAGSTTCWRWLMQPAAWPSVNEWVEGYWSGLNASPAPRRLVGERMTQVALVGRVRDQCSARPREDVLSAVLQAYETASLSGD